VIDDASTDGTYQEIVLTAERIVHGREITVDLVSNSKAVYETRCDHLGLELSETKYVIELQADMLLDDRGFDKRLVSLMDLNPDLIALSGRGTEPLLPIIRRYRLNAGSEIAKGSTLTRHIINLLIAKIGSMKSLTLTKPTQAPRQQPILNFDQDVYPTPESFTLTGSAGRLGTLINQRLKPDEKLGSIWLGQTVMRGPLIIDREKYFQVGGLETKSFFLGFDEHDLFLRAYIVAGYRVGFTPVIFDSPLDNGTTRRRRKLRQEIELIAMLRRVNVNRKSSYLYSITEQQAAELPSPSFRAGMPMAATRHGFGMDG
jgi:hypothetical protein